MVCASKRRLKVCSWILFIMGVGVVAATLCMATMQISNRTLNGLDEVIDVRSEKKYDASQPSLTENVRNLYEMAGLSGSNVSFQVDHSRNRCVENSCDIACVNVRNIYTAIQNTIQRTSCSHINTLVMKKQSFPLGDLKNNWLPSSVSLKQVVIRWSKITVIESNAFNAPLFEDTLAVGLYDTNVWKVESGALLGLYRLKYLTIKSQVQQFEPAVVQPVQSTLVKLTLNALVEINGNRNFFGACNLSQLTYLDLSNNIFNGSLSKNLFLSTPNLRHLIITQCLLQHIEKDAFEHLTDKLLYVDLSQNLLTTLGAGVFESMFVSQRMFMVNLSKNNWVCDCGLEAIAKLYRVYQPQFIDGFYCKTANEWYEVPVDEVDYGQLNCLDTESTSTPMTTTVSSAHHDDRRSSTVSPNKFKISCCDGRAAPSRNSNNEEYVQFLGAYSAFKLELLPENNTAIVSTDNSLTEVFVIWFSEQLETTVVSYSNASFDYDCVRYAVPELLVGPLQEDTTYTFCLLPAFQIAISPFNCLPLYVPPKNMLNKNVWITEEKKTFTIGIMCLIFLVAAVIGALMAYFLTRKFPQLLKGCSNVLVVKETNQMCSVATISQVDCQKGSPRRDSAKSPLTAASATEATQVPCLMSVKDLEKRSSCLKSSYICFEEDVSSCNRTTDEYETPKKCPDEYTIEQNGIWMMPTRSPPPLPKRNFNVYNP